MYVCVPEYVYIYVCGRQKRVLDPLQLKIQVVVGSRVGAEN